MAPRVVDPAQLPVQALPGRRIVEAFADHGVTLRLVDLPPAEPRTPHEHTEVAECMVVLAGKGQVWVAGETAPVHAGDAILVPAATPHMVLNTGSDVLKLACFFPTADVAASYVQH
jgi:mannose-6-phosphate isomerase-like protein (cupin superfamily)